MITELLKPTRNFLPEQTPLPIPDRPLNPEQQLLEKMYLSLANQVAEEDKPKVRRYLEDVISVVTDNPQAPDFVLLDLVLKTEGYHLLLLAFHRFDMPVWDTIETIREALANPDETNESDEIVEAEELDETEV